MTHLIPSDSTLPFKAFSSSLALAFLGVVLFVLRADAVCAEDDRQIEDARSTSNGTSVGDDPIRPGPAVKPHPDPFPVLGTESNDPKLIEPGEASMRLPGFGETLPKGWQGTGLRAFGHALGFHRKHQHSTGPCDFRMEDDCGFLLIKNAEGILITNEENRRPGVRSILSVPPFNYESGLTIYNIAVPWVGSSMYLVSRFDRDLIMKYDLPCRNTEHSETDNYRMSEAYPCDPDEIRKRSEPIRMYKAETTGGIDEQEGNANDLKGVWYFKTQWSSGREIPPKVLEGSTLTFAVGKRFTFKVGPLTTMHGTYGVDPRAEPKTIELRPTSGVLKGKKLLGIYKINGSTLSLIYAPPGQRRPSSFDSKLESKLTAITLTRQGNTE